MSSEERFDPVPSLLTLFCASMVGALISSLSYAATGSVVVTGMVCIGTGHLMKEYKSLLVPAGTGFILGVLLAYTAEHYLTVEQSTILIAASTL